MGRYPIGPRVDQMLGAIRAFQETDYKTFECLRDGHLASERAIRC
jgi:hypothetical protein